MPASPHLLNVSNHDRDRAGLRYVYPVVSRRAGGVSIGINLNPNNACNWACIYCQVPMLTRGGPPPLDLALLEAELNHMLDDVLRGGFMQREVPVEARRLVDIAFSGNGEPTSAPEFAEAVAVVVRIMQQHQLQNVKLRLITNGSLLHRPAVLAGVKALGLANGEVWFKVDAVDEASVLEINGVKQKEGSALQRLHQCAALAPTWVQTCMLAIDGVAPAEVQVQKYLSFLQEVRGEIKGVLLYGLARPSMQPDASRLSALSAAWMDTLGERISALGLSVKVSP